MITFNPEDFDFEVKKMPPLGAISHDWRLYKYSFYFDGAFVSSTKRYETESGAKGAGYRVLIQLIRGKYKENPDLAMTAAESMLINEYYKVMQDVQPRKLFEANKEILTKALRKR